MLPIGRDGIAPFDRRYDVVQKIAFEGREGGRGLEHVPFGPVVLLRAAVGHDDDHRNGVAVGHEVFDQDPGLCESLPFRFITADAVQQVEHRVLLVFRVTGRRVDLHATFDADGFRVVLDHLELAVGNAVAFLIESGRRLGECGDVIGVEHDGLARDSGFAAGRRILGTLLLREGEGGERQDQKQRAHWRLAKAERTNGAFMRF